MAIIINQEKVTQSVIEDEVKRIRPDYQVVFSDQSPEEQQKQLVEWAQENVIERILLKQAAWNPSLQIDQQKINEELGRIMKDAADNEQPFDSNQIETLRKELEEQVRIETLLQNIKTNVPQPSKQALQKYYNHHRKQFTQPEMIRTAHIVKHIEGYRSRTEAQAEIEAIYQQLQNGRSYEELANENSDCAGDSGNLGYFPRGRMVPEFEDIVFNLKINQISPIFETQFGFHIAKVYEKRSAQLIPFDAIRDELYKNLYDEACEKAVENYIDELKKDATIKIILEEDTPKTSIQKTLKSILVKPAGPDCNLACDYCFYLEKKDLFHTQSVHRMSENILEQLIRQSMEQSEDSISFGWQGGEPTLMGLHFFEKVIEFQKKYGKGKQIGNGLQTNGILIDKTWTKFLRTNNFLVGISLDGPEHIHDHYRKTINKKGTWEKVAENAKLLLEEGVATNVLSVVNDYSAQYPEEIYTYLKSLGFKYMQFIPIVESDPQNPVKAASFSVSAEAYGNFLCKIFGLWQADFANGTHRTSIRHFESLFYTYIGVDVPECTLQKECGTYIVVEHNGDVFSCDFFVEPQWKLGNLLKTQLIELLNSDKQHKFGRLKTDLPNKCIQCPWLNHCWGGCIKDRIRDSRDQKLNHFCRSYQMLFEHADYRFRKMANEWKIKQGIISATVKV